jgi:hypothetical protein
MEYFPLQVCYWDLDRIYTTIPKMLVDEQDGATKGVALVGREF